MEQSPIQLALNELDVRIERMISERDAHYQRVRKASADHTRAIDVLEALRSARSQLAKVL